MSKRHLNNRALTALIDALCAPQRFASRAEICSLIGISPPTLSYAENGRRGLSDDVSRRLTALLGVDEAAIWCDCAHEDVLT